MTDISASQKYTVARLHDAIASLTTAKRQILLALGEGEDFYVYEEAIVHAVAGLEKEISLIYDDETVSK
jgi:hypothetical protein